jgi:transposase
LSQCRAPLSSNQMCEKLWTLPAAATLMPLVEAIRAHVFAAERIHVDDTIVPVLAKGKTRTGRLWTYVRDDRLFAGPGPPAAVFFYSRDRGGEHPEQHLVGFAGLMQADAYAGFNRLYAAERKPAPIIEAACWAHARRKFFDLARIASEAVTRIDALFAIEREINGLEPKQRVAVRTERSRLLIVELANWLREQRGRVSKNSETAKAIDYSLKRWAGLTRFQLLRALEKLVDNAATSGPAQAAATPGVSREEFDRLMEQVAALTKQNAELVAASRTPAPVPHRRMT